MLWVFHFQSIINGVLEIEVTGVAAAVSGMIEMTQSIYKKIDTNMFELVNSPMCEKANLRRDDFWTLQKLHSTYQHVYCCTVKDDRFGDKACS